MVQMATWQYPAAPAHYAHADRDRPARARVSQPLPLLRLLLTYCEWPSSCASLAAWCLVLTVLWCLIHRYHSLSSLSSSLWLAVSILSISPRAKSPGCTKSLVLACRAALGYGLEWYDRGSCHGHQNRSSHDTSLSLSG